MKNSIFFSLLLCCLTSLPSCKKEGCTDDTAVNFNEDAGKDDGSCTYETSILFWYDQQTAQSLQADDVQNLRIYVDDQIIGSYAPSVYFPNEPSCGQNSIVSKSFNLGDSKSKTVNYRVIDDFDIEIWSGTTTLNASDCVAIKLTY